MKSTVQHPAPLSHDNIGVLVRADEPGRLALRTIQFAVDHGWDDQRAVDLAGHGRAAITGKNTWAADEELDGRLIASAAVAVEWLSTATVPLVPPGCELRRDEGRLMLTPVGDPYPLGVRRDVA